MREPIPIRPSLDDSWFTTEPQLHDFAGDTQAEGDDPAPAAPSSS